MAPVRPNDEPALEAELGEGASSPAARKKTDATPAVPASASEPTEIPEEPVKHPNVRKAELTKQSAAELRATLLDDMRKAGLPDKVLAARNNPEADSWTVREAHLRPRSLVSAMFPPMYLFIVCNLRHDTMMSHRITF